MQPSSSRPQATVAQRPRMVMVFAAAFVAGGAAAVGVNSVLDVWRTQAKPIVESEPIFVALRSLPQGAPVTVWDVGLRSWPKAMLPATAIRAEDSFEGCVLRHPLREGQPLLSVQLMQLDGLTAPGSESTPFDRAGSAAANAFAAAPSAASEADLWAPAATAPGPRPALLKPTSTDVAPLVPDAREPAVSPHQQAGKPTPAPSVAGPDVVAPGAEPLPDADDPSREPAAAPAAGAPPPVVVQPQPESTPRTAPGGVASVPDEPTLADTAAPAAAPHVDPPLVSVMKRPAERDPVNPADATHPAGGQQRPTGADGMVRYLVVPERIAREADTLFAAPATPARQQATPQPAAPIVPPVSKDLDVGSATAARATVLPGPEEAVAEAPRQPRQSEPQPAPFVTRSPAPRTAGPTPPPMRPTMPGQPPRPAEQPVAGRPRPAPRQSQAPARQPAAPARRGSVDAPRSWSDSPAMPEKPKRFGAVMSSITSGFEALVGGAGRKQPARPSDYDEAVATDDPQLLPAPLPR